MNEQESYFNPLKIYDYCNPKVLELYSGEKNILDIGCGSGALAKELKLINNKAVLYGIDISEDSGVIASQYLDRFFLVDLDNSPLPEFGVKFDLIIMADVLEHLKRPDLFLASLKKYLNHQGSLIISIPNIAHWSVRLSLLRGEFNYTKIGILDETHLRFFTYKTLTDMIDKCGYILVAKEYIMRDFLNSTQLKKLFIIIYWS
jgi:2-polyprenyl-3-methyl-5-hydroxy-6-metoxy-1,4-benzoquinol methylase